MFCPPSGQKSPCDPVKPYYKQVAAAGVTGIRYIVNVDSAVVAHGTTDYFYTGTQGADCGIFVSGRQQDLGSVRPFLYVAPETLPQNVHEGPAWQVGSPFSVEYVAQQGGIAVTVRRVATGDVWSAMQSVSSADLTRPKIVQSIVPETAGGIGSSRANWSNLEVFMSGSWVSWSPSLVAECYQCPSGTQAIITGQTPTFTCSVSSTVVTQGSGTLILGLGIAALFGAGITAANVLCPARRE